MTTGPEVIKEYRSLGKYRARLVKSKGLGIALDLREYVMSEKFEGFTRRGIRLTRDEARALQIVLKSFIEDEESGGKV